MSDMVRIPKRWGENALHWLILAIVVAIIGYAAFSLVGCSSGKLFGIIPGPGSRPDPTPTPTDLKWALKPLGSVAFLSLLAGIALLVISRGTRGWYPLGVGMGLIVVNSLLVVLLANTLALVLLGVTAIAAIALTWTTSRKAIKIKNGNGGFKWLRWPWRRVSSSPSSSSSPAPSSPGDST